MHGLELQLQKIYLKPAELVVAADPTMVSTVLGSCVSVTLFSPRLRAGAICHAVLPSGRDAEPNKYVDHSVNFMLDFFRQRGVNPQEIVAKLFGGANMFTTLDSGGRNQTVGSQNIRMAIESLRLTGLEPAAADTGGQQGRKLIFYTHTGEVFLKRVRNEHLQLVSR